MSLNLLTGRSLFKMKDNKILNFLTKIFGLDSVNEGYIGLTSFDREENSKREKEEDVKPLSKTSLTGILRRAS